MTKVLSAIGPRTLTAALPAEWTKRKRRSQGCNTEVTHDQVVIGSFPRDRGALCRLLRRSADGASQGNLRRPARLGLAVGLWRRWTAGPNRNRLIPRPRILRACHSGYRVSSRRPVRRWALGSARLVASARRRRSGPLPVRDGWFLWTDQAPAHCC